MRHFLTWCDSEQVENLNELSVRDIQQYRLWLGGKDDISVLTLKNKQMSVRVFLQKAGSVEAVHQDLYTKLMIPRVHRSQRSGGQGLETERATGLLEYLARYKCRPVLSELVRACFNMVPPEVVHQLGFSCG